MQVVFVAGPYRADSEQGVHRNIQRARGVAEVLWARGYVALCPHMNTAFMGGISPDDHFLAGGLELLRRCDAVVVCEGWQRSCGTRAEIARAQELGLPVYYWPELPPVEEE